MSSSRVALVQLDPGEDKHENLDTAFRLVEEAARRGVKAVLLPESFHVRGPNELRFETSEPIPGPLSERFASAAKRLVVTLLAGSYNEACHRPDRLFNTSLLFAPDGSLLATYSRSHLFDVTIEGPVVVNPGDLILADDNGGAVLSHEEAEAHLDHGLAVVARERRMREAYAAEYRELLPPEASG